MVPAPPFLGVLENPVPQWDLSILGSIRIRVSHTEVQGSGSSRSPEALRKESLEVEWTLVLLAIPPRIQPSQQDGGPPKCCDLLRAALLGRHCPLCVPAGEVFSQKRDNEQDRSEFIGQTLKLLVKRNVSLELSCR
uniref:Putative uncharacterized protein encoded by LINC01387 n=1 Tax=Homo sapiens TaxID=9606 RepID=CR064_HUMAN|nr:RecName: Full=Putative uncharacterized protein encoded by LINC01387 [Homo sapiens]